MAKIEDLNDIRGYVQVFKNYPDQLEALPDTRSFTGSTALLGTTEHNRLMSSD